MRNLLKLFVLVASLAWAGWILYQADLPAAWRSLGEATTPAQRVLLGVLFLLPSVLNCWLATEGWRFSYGGKPPAVGRFRLAGIRTAGEAVNQGTLSVGGEAIKLWLVRKDSEAPLQDASAVALSKFVLTLGQAVYVLLGLGLVFLRLPHHGVAIGQYAAFPAILGVALVGLLVAPLVLPASWRRRITGHPRLAGFRSGFDFLKQVLQFWRTHPREFTLALAVSVLSWVVVAAEFLVVAQVLGVPLSMWDALALEAVMNSIMMATFFIPGQLGSQEAGLVYVAQLYSLGTPFGVVMVVLRRLRELLWVAAGLAVLALLSSGSPRKLWGVAAKVSGEAA
jgi:hypothetical protein